jgi:Radical SAM superfamily/4Fe-4S single cluster domain
VTALTQPMTDGLMGGRLWLYSNYHCNLACTYCLTESAPKVARRELPVERLPEIAAEARATGFTALGVTGGEPFLVSGLPGALAAMAAERPTLVLTNGTLFTRRLLGDLAPLAGLEFAVQVSLDSADPATNDEMRGPRNFVKVVEAIPRLCGPFWSPFGPPVHGGRLDTDLLITRTTRPLSIPAGAMLRIAGAAGARPASDQLKIY